MNINHDFRSSTLKIYESIILWLLEVYFWNKASLYIDWEEVKSMGTSEEEIQNVLLLCFSKILIVGLLTWYFVYQAIKKVPENLLLVLWRKILVKSLI